MSSIFLLSHCHFRNLSASPSTIMNTRDNVAISPSPGGSNSRTVGGAVGGVIMALLVVMGVLVLCVVVVVKPRKKHGHEGMAVGNAVYEGGMDSVILAISAKDN